MGTLSSLFTETRINLRETKVEFFSDAELIQLSNNLFRTFYEELQSHDCKMVIGNEEISISGTSDYVISGKASLIRDLVMTNTGNRVPMYNLLYPELFSYKETATGITFYNYTEGTNVIAYYWKAFVPFTAVDDETPLDGIWDKALVESLTLKCKTIREHKVNDSAYYAGQAVSKSLSESISKYGTIARHMRGTLDV